VHAGLVVVLAAVAMFGAVGGFWHPASGPRRVPQPVNLRPKGIRPATRRHAAATNRWDPLRALPAPRAGRPGDALSTWQ
jgi:hypothetical protein